MPKFLKKLLYPAGWLTNPFNFMLSSQSLTIRPQKRKLSGVKLVERAPQKLFLTVVAKVAASSQLILVNTWKLHLFSRITTQGILVNVKHRGVSRGGLRPVRQVAVLKRGRVRLEGSKGKEEGRPGRTPSRWIRLKCRTRWPCTRGRKWWSLPGSSPMTR